MSGSGEMARSVGDLTVVVAGRYQLWAGGREGSGMDGGGGVGGGGLYGVRRRYFGGGEAGSGRVGV